MQRLIDKLKLQRNLEKEEMCSLLMDMTSEDDAYLFAQARETAKRHFKNKIYTRGLIEISNYCKNDCYYCGIRKSNPNLERYHLSETEILSCCETGYQLGFRTFVLQGGEDLSYDDDKIERIIHQIRKQYPDCAITLSLGEKEAESYERFFKAGANRYLLRHETADAEHYAKLHPVSMSASNRKQCLYNLKRIGYQTGTGFMVGSPGQTIDCLWMDLEFIRNLKPEMIGIGPFISHKDTPFSKEPNGTLTMTLRLLGILRLMHPNALIPATTALGTIDPKGRELGILSGANVVMPNLSPVTERKKYALYDNKICTGEEAAECRQCLENRMKRIGYEIVKERGDYVPAKEEKECIM